MLTAINTYQDNLSRNEPEKKSVVMDILVLLLLLLVALQDLLNRKEDIKEIIKVPKKVLVLQLQAVRRENPC